MSGSNEHVGACCFSGATKRPRPTGAVNILVRLMHLFWA